MRIICTGYLVRKQLGPSQIDREQLIREVEINMHQVWSQLLAGRQTNGKEINLWAGLKDVRTGGLIEQP